MLGNTEGYRTWEIAMENTTVEEVGVAVGTLLGT